MNNHIQSLLNQISELEDALEKALQEERKPVFFEIKGKRVNFQDHIQKKHRQLKINPFKWIANSQFRNWLSIPFIYSMIIPLVFFDITISLYQSICFPLFRISKVSRSDYIVFDRHYLDYLNFLEKFNCTYCSYGNGVIAYGREIIARTEQYWCPIKHAHKLLGTHRRYLHFLAYGEAEGYHLKLKKYRAALSNENKSSDLL